MHCCAFLFVAGHETTTVLLANAFRQFIDEPALLARIRENPADAPRFIEEMVRYRGTVHRLSRRATQDVVAMFRPGASIVIIGGG